MPTGQPMQAEMWLVRTVNDGVLAEIERYNSVINASAQKDNGESAVSWLSRMINEGLLPDKTLVSSTVHTRPSTKGFYSRLVEELSLYSR